MTDTDEPRLVAELGKPVRAIIESVLDCRMFSDRDESLLISTPIEILIHGNSRDQVTTNLSYAILGAAGNRNILWITVPEMVDNTQRLSPFHLESGYVLWSGYARFALVLVDL